MNYKKDKSYIAQRLEYKDAVDYIEELEQQIEDLQNENIFLRSHQKLDETFFKWNLEDMIKEKERLNNNIKYLEIKIDKAIKLLQKYNNKEANYYAPVQEVLDILGGDE